MKWKPVLFFLLACCAVACKTRPEPAVSSGVSDSLAASRKAVLHAIHYDLEFNIPAQKQAPIAAKETISFNYTGTKTQTLYLDFKENAGALKKLAVNGKEVPLRFRNEHLLIGPGDLKKGRNSIRIEFTAGNSALNRRDDFLYTLFVPDRARTVFPCFDQPDLKAVFNLTLTVPADWVAIANGRLQDSAISGTGKTLRFAPSDTISTYLFSFAAGRFQVAKEKWRNDSIEFFYRETDREKVAASRDAIFDLYKKMVVFNEQWIGIAYPFQKHGFVAIPDFQFGGMEHPGAILLQASTLFLTKDATEGQLNSRAQLLAHEVAHMWFGDLVTMDWFSDVWMKEVFANFMADKANSVPGHEEGFALKFLTDHLPPAYAVDRTTGANPIRQPLDNLENAGTLYGSIIYHKSPVMMRQLEEVMGTADFQKGVREYLKTYAYKNASWPDLIRILDRHTPTDLQAWNAVWVNEPGRPVFDYKTDYDTATSQITGFTVFQKPESGTSRVWPQRFDISFYYKGLVRTITLQDSLAAQQVPRAAERKRPLFIQFNASGKGYGVWPVDTAMQAHLFSIDNYVSRASAYISLYENMLNGRYNTPEQLLRLFASGLNKETVELNLRLLTAYTGSIYWNFMSRQQRGQWTTQLENSIWDALQQQKNPNNKKILFGCYQNVFGTEAATSRLYGIWYSQDPPSSVVLKEEDYTGLAFALALRSRNGDHILNQQLQRIKDPDRIKRFRIILPALSWNAAVRDQFFNGLQKKENRSNESAAGMALSYLHHPLRQPSAEKYLQKTLELLPEIQQTGDIFFPGNWLQSSFGSYQSASAYHIVTTFLKQQSLSPSLKAKVLQSTDQLRRAQSLIR
ncbi:M1 family metallopeptidase [Niabella beijingensis]|uniref:M1 family metallopeptidase n=1 Tax=Niabella beijingensis TaxID=2872700 RepID=UPI001CC13FBB|nr:M1 family aminopeptidase [Niabella beijingensis]MBZ4191201.1 aminopeptidase [Niabella beijingensis]